MMYMHVSSSKRVNGIFNTWQWNVINDYSNIYTQLHEIHYNSKHSDVCPCQIYNGVHVWRQILHLPTSVDNGLVSNTPLASTHCRIPMSHLSSPVLTRPHSPKRPREIRQVWRYIVRGSSQLGAIENPVSKGTVRGEWKWRLYTKWITVPQDEPSQLLVFDWWRMVVGSVKGDYPTQQRKEKIALRFAPFDCRYNLWG